MSRSKKITHGVVLQIGSWIGQGLSANDIAQKVGCTVGTLRVRCSQLGVSLRRKNITEKKPLVVVAPRIAADQPSGQELGGHKEQLVLQISHAILYELQKRAALNGTSGSTLATTLLERIVQDNLYNAVLDEN
jgi:hypothetical protein